MKAINPLSINAAIIISTINKNSTVWNLEKKINYTLLATYNNFYN